MKHYFEVYGENATYGDEVLRGGVDYEIDINGSGDLRFGVAACGVMRFTVIGEHPFQGGRGFVWFRKQIEEEDFTNMGYFIVHSATKRGNCYDIEARDGMSEFDIDAKSFLNSVYYPCTHYDLISDISSLFGYIIRKNEMPNAGAIVGKSPYWDGATLRDIIAAIAEASGCFARIDSEGFMRIERYQNTGINITNANYASPFVSDYSVSPIDKVQIRSTANDIGMVAGSGTNAYIIENNPMFHVLPDGDTTNYAQNILNAVSGITYTPCEVPMFNDMGLRVGDSFTIDGKKALVMSYRCSSRGIVISCTGSPTRDTQSNATNRDVIALIGKTNELVRTSAETESRLANAEGEISTIKQTASGIESTVSSIEGEITTIKQTSNSISATVGAQGIKISALETELSGVVKFTNLTDGITEISGDNIRTGTISAININGCTFTSEGLVAAGSLMHVKMTLSTGVLQFESTYNNGPTVLSGITAGEGMILLSQGPVFVESGSSMLTVQEGVVGITVYGNIEIYRSGQLFINIDSGNLYSYLKQYLG